ncbi:hypothetical protein [Fibrobacter sp. UWB11]|uniref:hypothetical protein n=1 Tax=Fibrobacter sp. UWB11 TaxID=1896202 RepID=UPI00092628BF|nr:hypothetical protein [Fibrobacter sp. UWB11]SIO43580.1 hypothetical protein SAMN05720758_2905 [Fibrobacter sp. UWB11]
MNNKKIIPLTFATLSVAGALSACSDTAVVGADVQGNSVALSSSSVTEPGSSNSLNGIPYLNEEGALAALRSVGKGTAVTFSHVAGESSYQTDSVTAHESFDRAVQTILDVDPTVHLIDEELVGYDAWYGIHKMNRTTYVVMKDEEGLVHGDIRFSKGSMVFLEREIDVGCGIPYVEKKDGSIVQMSFEDCINSDDCDFSGGFGTHYEVFFNDKSHPFHKELTAIKYLVTIDSTIKAEFEKDCALENGVLESNDDIQQACLVKAELKDGVETYTDPYWKKYATYMIESCILARDFEDVISRPKNFM